MNLSPLQNLLILSSVVWLLALGLLVLTPRLSAARRHLVWQVAFVVVAVGSPLALANLGFSLPILPGQDTPASVPSYGELRPGNDPIATTSPRPDTAPFPPQTGQALAAPNQALFLAWSLWTAGVSACLIYSSIGYALLHAVRRRARFIGYTDEAGLLSPVGRAGISAYSSPEIGIPMAVGIMKPVILIPEETLSREASCLRAILMHETAHIRRRDVPFLLIARLTAAMTWFNPLTWLAMSRLRVEAERAADDQAVVTGCSPEDYAEGLLTAVRCLRKSDTRFFPASRMADHPEISHRLARVLDTSLDRSSPASHSRVLAILGALIIGIPALLIRPVSAESSPPLPPAQTTGQSEESSSSPETSEDRDVEIEIKMIEVSKETYEKHQEIFEKAIASTNEESFQNFLRTLNALPGVDLLSAPKVKHRLGSRASIQIARVFRYPSEFDASGRPTNFVSKDLGVFFELDSKVTGKTITINGTLRVTELLGFIEGTPRTPTFQTREAQIFRELQSHEVAVLSVPWEKENVRLTSEVDSSPKRPDPIPTGKRMFFTLKAELHPPRKRLSKNDSEKYLSDLLTTTILTDRDLREVPAIEAISSIWNEVWEANESQISINWNSHVPSGVPKVTLSTKGMTVLETLEEIEKQTGLAHVIKGSHIYFTLPEKPSKGKPTKDLPYGIPVPDRAGFVISPHSPESGQVDVRGFAPGTEIKCPYTGKLFLAP